MHTQVITNINNLIQRPHGESVSTLLYISRVPVSFTHVITTDNCKGPFQNRIGVIVWNKLKSLISVCCLQVFMVYRGVHCVKSLVD